MTYEEIFHGTSIGPKVTIETPALSNNAARLQNRSAEQSAPRQTLLTSMFILGQESGKPYLTSDDKRPAKQFIPQLQTTPKTILLNQTLPTAHKCRKNPTVTPTHTFKTLLRKIVTNQIENYPS